MIVLGIGVIVYSFIAGGETGAQKPPVNIEQTNPYQSPNFLGDNNQFTINPEVNPNAPVVIYNYDGTKRVWDAATGTLSMETGESEVFKKMQEMERDRNWPALRDLCEEELKKAPEWLTPSVAAGKAYVILGDVDKGIERIEYVRRKAAGRKDYEVADRLREEIRQKTGK